MCTNLIKASPAAVETFRNMLFSRQRQPVKGILGLFFCTWVFCGHIKVWIMSLKWFDKAQSYFPWNTVRGQQLHADVALHHQLRPVCMRLLLHLSDSLYIKLKGLHLNPINDHKNAFTKGFLLLWDLNKEVFCYVNWSKETVNTVYRCICLSVCVCVLFILIINLCVHGSTCTSFIPSPTVSPKWMRTLL